MRVTKYVIRRRMHSLKIQTTEVVSYGVLLTKFIFSTTSDNKYCGFRILPTTKRRTSSDNISTPNSGRSRSPSLLSSEYIPEEDDLDEDDVINKDSKRRSDSQTGKSGSRIDPGSASKAKVTNMDELYQLVHELKEEDLNYHKNLIAKKEAAKAATTANPAYQDDLVNPDEPHQALVVDRSTGAISKDLKRDGSHHKRHHHHSRKSSTKRDRQHERPGDQRNSSLYK